MKRPLLLPPLLCLLWTCLAVPAAPAAGAPAPAGKTVVEFWHAMSGPEAAGVFAQYVRGFEAENPDIHIVPVFQGNYNNLSQKLIASVIARSNPPLAQMYEGWTARFLTRDLLDPVENYLHGEDGLTSGEIEDIWKPFRDNNTWDGKLVTMPFNKSGYVLYANLDMLRQAGYDKPPETWEELRSMAKRLTLRDTPGGNPRVHGFLLRSRIEAYTVFLFRAGESYLSPDCRKATLGTPGALEALQLVTDMVNADHSAYTDSTYPATPFGSGQVAMYIHSSAAFPFNDRNIRGRFQWVAAPLPHPPGRKGGILFQGTNIGIFARPHSAQVRRAAWRFLKYITNTRNAALWSIETGYVPIRRSSVETPEMSAFLETHPNYRVPISLIPEAVFDPRPAYWDQMRPQIESYAVEAMNGRRRPADALRIIQEKLEEIIAYETR